jgi:S-adenosylmethionine-diacylgycerolhomoserine-N-methlytransferase
MGLTSDLRVLYNLAFTRVRGATHGERLDSFYRAQAGDYDAFRRRLFLGERLARLHSLRIIDLCPSLLATADERIRNNGWANVQTTLADATAYEPPDGPVDVVTFSYSLTMIPNWFQALERAYAALKPGGVIGVVDFYVSRKWPMPDMRRHSNFQRFFWPTWFGHDNVFPSPDHLPWLQSRFQTVKREERLGQVPYLMLKAPYYIFLGRKA